MDFLKPIFGESSLTYDQLVENLKGNDKIKIANLADGAYVGKEKFDTEVGKLKAANDTIGKLNDTVKKFDGVDVVDLNKQITDLQTKYNTDVGNIKLNSALDVALMGAKAHDPKAIKPFLNMDNIKLDNDKLLGLEEQLSAIKTNQSYLFSGEAAATVNTGQEHTGALDDGADKFVAAAMQAVGLKSGKDN